MRRVNCIENFFQVIRCGMRMPAQNPIFAIVVALTATLSLCSSICLAQVDPTWVHRFLPDIPEKAVDSSSGACHYQPIFGEGDSAARVARSVARFEEVKVDPQGACPPVTHAREEQIYLILEGSGVL